jgi:hypothetical protein
VAGVISKRVKQSEQERDGHDLDEQFWRGGGVIFEDVGNEQFLFLEVREVTKEIAKDQKNKKTAQAIAKRDDQFTQQVTVEQPHRTEA